MDTRFWGPSGWKLLHLIAAEPAGDRAPAVLEWMELLEYVLPCKYCRASFHDYIRLQPLSLAMVKDSPTFSRWMYEIHNRVNGKLRGQGLLTTPDPSWTSVKAEYTILHKGLCKSSPLLGWDFMTSVAFSTPTASYKPVPMPDLPEQTEKKLDDATQNRYNLLSRSDRIRYLKRWWRLIPSILPCEAWRLAWSRALHSKEPPLDHGREAVMRWMWQMEDSVCGHLKCPRPHASRTAMNREVSAYESNCSKARRGKTCRSRKQKRKTSRFRDSVRSS